MTKHTRFRLPLAAVLASPVPLPEEELGRLLNLSETDSGDLFLRMGTPLERGENEFGRRTVAVAHRYIAEWLTSKDSEGYDHPAGIYWVSRTDGLHALAEGCHSIAMNDPDTLTGYETTYAIPLEREAGANKGLRELERCYGLATQSSKLADRLSAQGKLAPAHALYEQALSICELRTSELETPKSHDDLVWALGKDGILAEELGDRETAERYCARALVLGTRIGIIRWEVKRSCLAWPPSRRRAA